MNNIEIYNALKNKFDENKTLGRIVLQTEKNLIPINSKDIIGNSIQEWLRSWFKSNNVSYTTPKNTQEFPDYIINPKSPEMQYLEIKSWFGGASPAFDIANFESYIATTLEDPKKLDVDYLIFKYNILEDESIIIENVFLKKIWEISGPSSVDPIKVQRKKGVIYNLRPLTWENPKAKPFNNRLDLVKAISNTYIEYTKKDESKSIAAQSWLAQIQYNYLSKVGSSL